MRIRHLVERDEEGPLGGDLAQQRVEIEVRELARDRDRALVPQAGRERVELGTVALFHAHITLARFLVELAHRALVGGVEVDDGDALRARAQRLEDCAAPDDDALHRSPSAAWISATTARAAARGSAASRMGRPTTR